MNVIAAENWKHTVDSLVTNSLDKDVGMSVKDIIIRTGLKRGTVVASLNRLDVRRKWDGNQRYGRYRYFGA